MCTFSPLFYHLPRIYDYKVFNEEHWILSKAKNLLFGENKENIQKLLDNLSYVSKDPLKSDFRSRMPLPEILAPISMTVYTQEPCEDLLLKFFGDLISFEASDPLSKFRELILKKDRYKRRGGWTVTDPNCPAAATAHAPRRLWRLPPFSHSIV